MPSHTPKNIRFNSAFRADSFTAPLLFADNILVFGLPGPDMRGCLSLFFNSTL